MNKEIYRTIKDNNLDYFKDNQFDSQTKTEIVNNAVALGKLDIVRFYMDKGVKITDCASFLNLMATNRKIDILQYLDTKVDLTEGGHIYFLSAVEKRNLKFSLYLADKIKNQDDLVVKTALGFIANNYSDINSTQPLIKKLMPYISSEALHEFLNTLSDNEKKTVIFESYLNTHVQNDKTSKRVKI